MLRKLIPVMFLLAGTGAGIAAGMMFTMPSAEYPATGEHTEEKPKKDKTSEGEYGTELDYVKMANQFVVPIVTKNEVTSHVVMSLNLEVVSGTRDQVFTREPKLRSVFLRVLFDHANMGGFHGPFTTSEHLDPLRLALLETARLELGDTVKDVLIVNIARQDAR
ncbi:MAG: flagellar basal body-associated protein FliL [Rhodobacteraceae bacterium]|nr:flagellar basal body-associated protein FliL [Paracoccaceae bacterium]